MPWKETSVVDERRAFIDEAVQRKRKFAEVCRQYGVSRKTGYKWIQRFYEGGMAGLVDRSHRPHQLVRVVGEETVEAIVAARQRYPGWGPKKLKAFLVSSAPEKSWPALSTIGLVLKRQGLIQAPRRRTRTPHSTQPLAAATGPNVLWTGDFKGAYRVAGQYCHPLTIADGFSRYFLKLVPLDGEQYGLVRPVFESAFREYGLPWRIRTDNGPPFAAVNAAGGLSRLAVWWVRLGIIPERIEPRHPEQNGRHERMHRTLKAEAIHPGWGRRVDHEPILEKFRRYYNDERPHEALGQCTPSSVYVPSPRPYPEDLPDPEYPSEFVLRRVDRSGMFSWCHRRLALGAPLAKQEVGLEPISDGRWQVWFGPIYLGLVVEQGRKGVLFLRNEPK